MNFTMIKSDWTNIYRLCVYCLFQLGIKHDLIFSAVEYAEDIPDELFTQFVMNFTMTKSALTYVYCLFIVFFLF